MLLEANADVNDRTTSGDTALSIARRVSTPQIVQRLIDADGVD
jgi:ankyrin repeat protein